jgi:hypothetical protein
MQPNACGRDDGDADGAESEAALLSAMDCGYSYLDYRTTPPLSRQLRRPP